MQIVDIYFEDLNPDKQQEMIDKGFYHENININPIAIIDNIEDIVDLDA